MWKRTRAAALISCMAGCGLLVACKKDDERPLPVVTGSSAVGKPAALTPPEEEDPDEPRGPTLCKANAERVWEGIPNTQTGLTKTRLEDGRVAVGFAVGNRPRVLLFDTKGKADVVPVPVSAAVAQPEKGARRSLLRVTPGRGSGGTLVAYADYVDTLEGERRRVVCGPADSSRSLLEYEGRALVGAAEEDGSEGPDAPMREPAPQRDPPKEEASAEVPGPTAAAAEAGVSPKGEKPEPTGERPATAERRSDAGEPGAEGKRALPRLRDRGWQARLQRTRRKSAVGAEAAQEKGTTSSASGEEKAAVAASGTKTASAPAPAEPPPGKSAAKGAAEPRELKELRGCRTLVDEGGTHAWAVGTELRGDRQAGGVDWSIVFFAERELGRGRVPLRTIALGKDPERLHKFEVPTARELPGGGFLLATRYRGALLVWTLDANKRPSGAPRTYSEGFPTLPRFARDGVDLLMMTSQRGADGRFGLRVLRAAGSQGPLPSSLLTLPLGGGETSKAEPSFARLGDQRFLLYHKGERQNAKLVLVPIDDNMAMAGNALRVDGGVVESLVFELEDRGLMTVYIRRRPAGKAELVSRRLACAG